MINYIKHNKTTVILVLILILGLGIMFYPSFSNWWNSFHATRAISNYAETVNDMSTDEKERILEEARAYNQALSNSYSRFTPTESEDLEYNQVLDITGTGIMGYIEIKKIKVSLPIYHGVADSVLQIAVGHIEGSSLPVGGEGTHAVLSGHRGLPSAKLFTDIDKLVEGDTFVIRVLDETYTYQVDKISIVLPAEISGLEIEEGEDLVTLVTCTPYGINTHRLLVRGHRIPNEGTGIADVTSEALQIEPDIVALFIGLPILMLLLILLLVHSHRFKSRNQ